MVYRSTLLTNFKSSNCDLWSVDTAHLLHHLPSLFRLVVTAMEHTEALRLAGWLVHVFITLILYKFAEICFPRVTPAWKERVVE